MDFFLKCTRQQARALDHSLGIKPLYRHVQCSAREEYVPAAMVMGSGGFAPDFQPCPTGCKGIINSMITKAYASCALRHIDAANSRLVATHFTKHYMLRCASAQHCFWTGRSARHSLPQALLDIAMFNHPLECCFSHQALHVAGALQRSIASGLAALRAEGLPKALLNFQLRSAALGALLVPCDVLLLLHLGSAHV